MITLEGYKSYAEINSPNSDAKLTLLVDYVNEFVAKYCGTSFSPTAVTGERHVLGGSEIILTNAPILSVDTVVDSGGSELAITYTENDIGAITLEKAYVGTPVFVSYTYGYAEIPSPLKISCYELITYFNKREFNKSKSLAGENITYLDPNVIPAHIRAAFDLYRVV